MEDPLGDVLQDKVHGVRHSKLLRDLERLVIKVFGSLPLLFVAKHLDEDLNSLGGQLVGA